MRGATVDYLRGREQTTNVYREVMRSVWLENEARQRVSALAYVVDRGHVQYAGRLSLAEQLRFVQQGHGRSGNNRDYVLSTVKSIEAQGFRDAQLHQLAMMLHGGSNCSPDGAVGIVVTRPCAGADGTRPNNSACSSRAAATIRLVAVSITVEIRSMNSRRLRPGGNGSRNSTTSVPG